MDTPANRVPLRLPKVFLAQLNATAKRRSVNVSTLFYGWILDAARLAESGNGHLLPRDADRSDNRVFRWSHDQRQYDRQRAAIEGAGSSVPAVLITAGWAFIEADGDAMESSWPPKSALLAA